MALDINNVLLILMGLILTFCFILMLMDYTNPQSTNPTNTKKANNNIEAFDPVIDAIQEQIKNQSPEQLKSTINALQQRLIDYGYAPDLDQYVKKTALGPNDGKCLVSNAEDRDKYINKSDIPPPGPRIDLSQYVKKSAIPPEKVCPPAPTIDLSAYVKKSTLPPNEKCPPCIAPKVKVSAGLCRECPPPPPCPAPEPCPACNCPEPQPCPPQKECKKCDEIRYIKVPAIITKTITIDQNGNVISQNIESGTNTTPSPQTQNIIQPTTTQHPEKIPTTTFPTMTTKTNINLAQTLANTTNSKSSYCPTSDLNSAFSSYGITGRNESNFIFPN
jgi:hypothetical protein